MKKGLTLPGSSLSLMSLIIFRRYFRATGIDGSTRHASPRYRVLSSVFVGPVIEPQIELTCWRDMKNLEKIGKIEEKKHEKWEES